MALEILQIDSLEQLQDHAVAWNDLWERSEITMPTKRAELLMGWLERFDLQRTFRALVVQEEGRFLAAIPFIERRLGKLLRVGTMPLNSWTSVGDLLLDVSCEEAGTSESEVLQALIKAFRKLPWPLLWLNTIEYQTPRWQALQAEMKVAEHLFARQWQFDIGLVDIANDWQNYFSNCSKNHRKNMKKGLRKATAMGNLELTIHRNLPASKRDALLEECFEVEDRSWKGVAGTSVLKSPGMFAFFKQQAKALAEKGELEIITLALDDWLIAFEYGYRSGGVYYSHKCGYDAAYSDLSPGQLLFYLLLERYHEENEVKQINSIGVLSEATAKWCTRAYPIGRLVIGTSGALSAGLIGAYKHVWPRCRKWKAHFRGSENDSRTPKLGAVPKCRKRNVLVRS